MNKFQNKKHNLNTQDVLSMKSSGYYSQRTAGAKISIDNIQPLMVQALKEIPNFSVLRMADFGSADGGTSQEMWANLVKEIRDSNDRKQIEILYTDLASNDFSTLFRTMQGMQGDINLAFQNKFSDVFIHGCGTGFHKQLMSNDSLSLGFSATAMHYVSQKPCQIKNHVHMVGANEFEKSKFKLQAQKDWEAILLNRAKELVSGGRFICLNFGIDEKGRFLGNTGGHSMFDKFSFHWKKLEIEGIISNKEYIDATFAQHYRTVDEFLMPFKDPQSLISKTGLRLKSYKTSLTNCPYKKFYIQNKNSMTAADYAKSLIPTMRSWSETVFRTALYGRDENKINKIIDLFYNSYQKEIADNPEGHSMDYIHVIMDIEKI